MALKQSSEVDLIGIEEGTDECCLTIFDELGWKDHTEHIKLLQDKLNNYLKFIDSHQLEKAFPKAKGRKRRIEIVADKTIPVEVYDDLNEKIKYFVEQKGHQFRWYQLKS